MDHVTVVDHPLLSHSLTVLRDKHTQTEAFRWHANVVSKILLVEATKNLGMKDIPITTPLTATTGKKLGEDIVVVPVLRAGLAMLFALQDFLPSVSVGFIGLQRDEKTAIAKEYYQKLPRIFAANHIFILDPMLATGGSFGDTIEAVRAKGGKKISLVCIVSAPTGLEHIQTHYPGIHIVTGAIDESLNEQKFIVPGLGDFGDRYFGTTQQ